MADLPPEPLDISPPFTYVVLDVFGQSQQVLFTCMSTRPVHIEVIESMDTSSCINALRRFIAIRWPTKQLRSDTERISF